jgi:hypothetical protein
MTKPAFLGILLLVMLPAWAEETATAADAQAEAARASETTEPEKAETDAAAQPGTEAFVPPPGFKTKKQGALTLYCKRDSTVGTRFKTEKCYNEAQMKDYLLALEEQKRDIDRIRNTCANAAVCAPQ